MNFSIRFSSNDNDFLYLVMKKVYPVFIARFALCFITMSNWQLYIIEFYEIFCLVQTLLLSLSYNFQIRLLSFCKPLSNPFKVIIALQLVLKSLMILYALYLSYYIPAKMATTNKTIAIVILKFVAKTKIIGPSTCGTML